MSASLRAGNSSDGYLQIDGADIVTITASGMSATTGKTITANAVSTTGVYRATPVNNSASLTFDLATGNNFLFSGTPGTITFSNRTQSGQTGIIKLIVTGSGTMAAATNTKINSSDLTALGSAGTYLLTYFCDGTDVFVVASRNTAA